VSAPTIPVAGLTRRPEFTNAFVGRERERAALAALIQPPTPVPLTTVTGAGGIGKTRLALHAAADVVDAYADGAWLIELASVDSADAVADVVLVRLGGRQQAGRSALESLSEFAHDRRMLVVLDNCEHVVVAAAACVDAIVGGESVVLATSREPLAVPGERVFPVPSLPVDAAVALFADRAAAADPSFSVDDDNGAVVAQICRDLDGMPLAIELAAARVRSMTVAEIAHRLGARFRLLRGGPGTEHRHRTLRATVQWSYDLLSDRQRVVFDEFSVFRGGFTIEAVAAVCLDEVDAPLNVFEVDDVVDALVARCLVVAHRDGATTRYSLLETFRQFGEEALADRGDDAPLRARHAQHFLAVAEEARRQISTAQARAGMATFEDEWDNVRAAFDWFASNDNADGALRLVVACYWFAGPGFRSGLRAWGERAIALDGAPRHPLWSAAAGVTGMLRRGIGDFQGGEILALEALALEARTGERARFEPAFALLCCLYRRDDERALQILPEVERIAERDEDPIELANARYMRVVLDVVRGVEGVDDYARRAVSDAECTGNPVQLALGYAGLLAATSQHDRDVAVSLLDTVRRWARLANNPMIAANAASWIAGAPNASPLDRVAFIRDALVGSSTGGYFGNLDLSLGALVIALPHFGRDRSAAILLGGLMTMEAGDSMQPHLIGDATARLSDALGEELDPLLDEGRGLPKRELARLALSEVDLVLDTQGEA
jgi:predicted ATPase